MARSSGVLDVPSSLASTCTFLITRIFCLFCLACTHRCRSSSWAKQRLEELLRGVEVDASESSVVVTKVDKLEGDAEVKMYVCRQRQSSYSTQHVVSENHKRRPFRQ